MTTYIGRRDRFQPKLMTETIKPVLNVRPTPRYPEKVLRKLRKALAKPRICLHKQTTSVADPEPADGKKRIRIKYHTHLTKNENNIFFYP